MTLTHAIARLTAPGGYCSGVLVGPDLVLTCGHFLRGRDEDAVLVTVGGKRLRPSSVTHVPTTDIALAALPAAVDVEPLPLGPAPRPFDRTVTFGFGGRASGPAARPGLVLATLPLAVSRGMATVVRPAGLIYTSPPAVYGDSGGPVLHRGAVVGVQSLILDPLGRNLRLATVSWITDVVRGAVEVHTRDLV